MKKKYFFLLFAVCVVNSSYTTNYHLPGKIYNFFYLDNSHSKRYQSFTQDMFDTVERKVDSLKDNKNSYLGFFLSNGQKPEFASNYKGAKSIINKLTSGYTSEPNSFFDKSIIVDNVLNSDLSFARAINFHFFVTESYLVNDLLSSNAGFLFNNLPAELQYLLGCEGEINVTIYYPASSKKIQIQNLRTFCDFREVHKKFSPKIKFQFHPI